MLTCILRSDAGFKFRSFLTENQIAVAEAQGASRKVGMSLSRTKRRALICVFLMGLSHLMACAGWVYLLHDSFCIHCV